MIIRNFEPEDLADLLPLYEELGYPTTHSALQERLTEVMSHDDYHLLVACWDDHLVAFLAYAKLYFFERDGTYYRILGLVVSESYRQRGVATALLDEVKSRAVLDGIDALALNSGLQDEREKAHRFYERYGFQKASYGFALDLKKQKKLGSA